MSQPRPLVTGLIAGLLMNVFGWLGNQILLGRFWDAAIASSAFGQNRVRTVWHEVGSLIPDMIYGVAMIALYLVLVRAWGPGRRAAYVAAVSLWAVAIATPLLGTANSGLLPWHLAVLTTLLALAIMIPVSEFVFRRHPLTASRPA